jgi:hypothetical protein
VREVESILVYPQGINLAGQRSVTWFAPGISETIIEGDVYLMNENGKTVADYHLYPVKD